MRRRRMFNVLLIFVAILSCQNPQIEDEGGETRLRFVPSTADMTRGTMAIGDYFSRLAVQMFDQAPFVRNRVSEYTGPLFGDNGSMTLNLNTEWSTSHTGTW